jgi:UDP-4-amino-4,6-dideoxy-N-acetyl-beta-L-altrosamine transaminase
MGGLLNMMDPLHPIPYGKQTITEADIDAVVSVLRSDFLTQGPSIAIFENEFAKYIGSMYAVAVSNGTAALHLCMLALDVTSDVAVITTPITFAASANCVRYCGGIVDFVDIDPETALMDLDKLEQKLKEGKRTYKGIVAVDFAGRAIDTEKLRSLADTYGLWIVEDACHAPGGFFLNSKNENIRCGDGKYAELSIFSFHPVKHIASGEGGMITTNDPILYQRLLLLRTHGITKDPRQLEDNHGGWYYEMQTLGFNYRLTDFQAALGMSQLSRADEGLVRRRYLASRYDEAFKKLPIRLFNPPDDNGHAYHLYVIHTAKRKELYEVLRAHNIFAQVHYIPVHTFPYYKSLGFTARSFPNAEEYYSGCLSLPMFPGLTDEQQNYVIETIQKFHLA